MLKKSKRFFEISKELVSLWYNIKFKHRNNPGKKAILLRNTLEKLGSVFIKFGQLLSLRADLIPQEYCHELFYLLEDVKPFDNVEKIIESEFGKSPDELFNDFKFEPIGSASFGQVHEAYLKTGEKVAVKIQRPGIIETVKRDISIMKFFAKVIDLFSPNKISNSVHEFEMWTNEELDYIKEAEYTDEFYAKSKNKYNRIKAPKIYKKFTTSKIITQEFIDGFTISKYLRARRNKDNVFLSKVKKQGFSEKEVANKLLSDAIKQVYLEGRYHADPHPANIIFAENRELYYIDFGISGTLTKEQRTHHLRYVRSCINGDYETAFKELTVFCEINKNLEKIKKEHTELIKEIYGFSGNPPVAKFLIKTLQLIRKYNLKVPKDRLRYFRTIITLQSVVYEIYPELELNQVSKNFITVSLVNLIENLPEIIQKNNWQRSILKWIDVLEEGIRV